MPPHSPPPPARPSASGSSHIGQLYKRSFRKVRAWIQRQPCVTHEAEDLAQESFIVALQSAENFRGEGSPEAWLFGIARNVVRHHQRSVRTEKRGGSEPDLPFDDDLAHDGATGQVSTERLDARRSLEKLTKLADDPPRRRDWNLVAAHHLEGATLDELAISASCSTDAIKARLLRARRRIASTMEESAA